MDLSLTVSFHQLKPNKAFNLCNYLQSVTFRVACRFGMVNECSFEAVRQAIATLMTNRLL